MKATGEPAAKAFAFEKLLSEVPESEVNGFLDPNEMAKLVQSMAPQRVEETKRRAEQIRLPLSDYLRSEFSKGKSVVYIHPAELFYWGLDTDDRLLNFGVVKRLLEEWSRGPGPSKFTLEHSEIYLTSFVVKVEPQVPEVPEEGEGRCIIS